MSNLIELESLFHRSKERILELGEVFTPEQYVEDMLDLLSKGKRNFWNNEENIFLEPSCGHGNIVIPLYRRRLEAFFRKAQSLDIKNPALYAIANAINTLWAIDIDAKNIQNCRTRLLVVSLEFLKTKTSVTSDYALIQKNQKFFAHFICALKWQIHENETLSSLAKKDVASRRAGQTKIGGRWFQSHGHRQLNFELSWVTFFRECEQDKVIPMEYERSLKFIDSVISGSNRGFNDFEFAKFLIPDSKTSEKQPHLSRSASVGV